MKKITEADNVFFGILEELYIHGEERKTRNSKCMSEFFNYNKFTSLPLVTVKKTAWKTALKEIEWFLSGEIVCPEGTLRDKWWKGQLGSYNQYDNGYPTQLRRSTMYNTRLGEVCFDQIKYLINSLKNHPNSRRHVISAWNTGEMANITETNKNPNTPTTCHMTMIQCFVRNENKLEMMVYNRSQDVLLGLPHNWVQHWALGLYLAHWSGLDFKKLIEIQGDYHIYDEPTHLDAAREIIDHTYDHVQDIAKPIMTYNPPMCEDEFGTPKFTATDFRIEGEIPEPIKDFKIKRL